MGERVVYLAGSLALAVLETRVHLSISAMRQPYTALQFSVPQAQVIDIPQNWQDTPTITQTLGSAWVKKRSALVLQIPSVIIPTEYNYLLNPLHPKLEEVKLVDSLEFIWDERLF
jgi:RES domain-containing protein